MLHNTAFTFLIIYSQTLWNPCGTVYEPGTIPRQKIMVRAMALGLVKDAQMKVLSIRYLRDQYYKSSEFQLAEMVYHMRTRFKKMVIFTQKTERNITMSHYNHDQNIEMLTYIQQKAMDIDNLILMIEEWLIKREKKADVHVRMQKIMRRRARGDDHKIYQRWQKQAQRSRPPADYEGREPPALRKKKKKKTPAKKTNLKWEYSPGDGLA